MASAPRDAQRYGRTFITGLNPLVARPRKCRHIRLNPSVRYFKPQGIPIRELRVIVLKEEELEALALADARRLDHEASAALMNVSRSTFSRVLAAARMSVATALVDGAALRIGGGDFRLVSDEEPCQPCCTVGKGSDDENDR